MRRALPNLNDEYAEFLGGFMAQAAMRLAVLYGETEKAPWLFVRLKEETLAEMEGEYVRLRPDSAERCLVGKFAIVAGPDGGAVSFSASILGFMELEFSYGPSGFKAMGIPADSKHYGPVTLCG